MNYLLIHVWDSLREFHEELFVQVKIITKVTYSFFSFTQKKRPRSRKWSDFFPQITCFRAIFVAGEITEGSIVGETRVTNGHSVFNSPHIGRWFKMVLNLIKLWSSEGATMKIFRLWSAVFPQRHEVSTKRSVSNFVYVQFIRSPFQCSTIF